ncbi:MAG TPA: BatA domain-containing protein [Planctomycetota bacterium]|nr:BatA domain-containing protein [Planctomycetota bacterium]HRU51021.1 BatA domain-containing protein [Planctomycetota bacterium]
MISFHTPSILWGLLLVPFFYFLLRNTPQKKIYVNSLSLWQQVAFQDKQTHKQQFHCFQYILLIIIYASLLCMLAFPYVVQKQHSIILENNYSQETQQTQQIQEPIQLYICPNSPPELQNIDKYIDNIQITKDKQKAHAQIYIFSTHILFTTEKNIPNFAITTIPLQQPIIITAHPILYNTNPYWWETPFITITSKQKNTTSLLTTKYGSYLFQTPTLLYIGLPLLQTNLLYLPDFPILWNNILQYYFPLHFPLQSNLPQSNKNLNTINAMIPQSNPPRSNKSLEQYSIQQPLHKYFSIIILISLIILYIKY